MLIRMESIGLKLVMPWKLKQDIVTDWMQRGDLNDISGLWPLWQQNSRIDCVTIAFCPRTTTDGTGITTGRVFLDKSTYVTRFVSSESKIKNDSSVNESNYNLYLLWLLLDFYNKCQHRVVMNLYRHNSNSHLSIAGLLYNMHCVKHFMCIILISLYMCSFHPLCLEGVYI